ncbi:MAG: efflux RND transporter periplasmic adaptor subunit, partial [Smithellaceae bacterium]|nr:efflux RND transporter periplasmic adaptor subunit [Smithellaceae bacterium]
GGGGKIGVMLGAKGVRLIMKKIIITVLILAILAGGGYFYFYKGKEEAPKFRLDKAMLKDIRTAVTATGTANAVKTVLVGTQASGTIKEIFVDFNSAVKKGQVLATLDSSSLEAQIEQARANILYAMANLEKAEAALQDAKRTAERNRILYEKNFIARNDLDVAETSLLAAEAQVKAVKAQVEQANAALKQSDVNLRYTKILSPVNGTVISRNVDVGQTVAASFQTPTLFNIAEDLTQMQVNASIVEADVGGITEGQPVEFTVDAYPEMVFKGKVFQIRNAPVTVQNVVTYDVIIRVANPEFKLKPGMTANVSIIVANRDNVLSIPNAALRFRLLEKGGTGERKDPPAAKTAPSGERKGGPPEGRGGPSAAGREPAGERKGPPAEGAVQTGERRGPPGERKGPPGERRGGPSAERGQGVWALENGQPKRINIVTGITDGNYTEVVSGDLREGQEVIIEYNGGKNKKKQERPLGTGPGFIR